MKRQKLLLDTNLYSLLQTIVAHYQTAYKDWSLNAVILIVPTCVVNKALFVCADGASIGLNPNNMNLTELL